MIIIPFDLYSFLCGPALIFSIFVFIAGCIYRIIQYFHISLIKIRQSITQPCPVTDNSILFGNKNAIRKILTYIRLKVKRTILGSNPVMGTVSVVFHVFVFITPVFLSAHNVIADQFTGLSLFSVQDNLMDKFTVLIIIICLFFLFRRIFIPRVRVLSTTGDFILLLLVILPFISAFISYHQFFNYKISLYIHIITGEIAIMAVPFTKLGHMPFIIFSRFFIKGEYNSRYADRTW
jgi:nitrate reductase gamma subunit